MLRWAVLGIVVIAVAVAAALARGGEDAPPRPPEAAPEAAERGLEAHLRELQRIADEHGGTRSAGSPGDAATADYIEARLREAGYRVRRDRFRVPFFRETGEPRLVVGGDGVEARTLQFSPGGTAAGRVRAAGLGCAPGDFAALRDGEIALVRRGTCFFRVKARNAQRAGAAAVLVTDDGLVPGSLQRPGLDVPALAVREGDVVPGRRAELRVRARSELAETANVIGEIGPEGSVVMAGAHLDSVPAGPGLNDNGSGIAALLHIAERVAGRERPLRFGFWGAEEIGLIGSRRYVDALSASERDSITAYVNLDMVGTPDARLEVYDGAPRIELVLRRHLPRGTGDIDLGDQSDHAPFEAAGIPIGGIFTGLDDCYHEACDTLGNVDREVLAGSASAAEAALLELAG